jgi:hypothetical protein
MTGTLIAQMRRRERLCCRDTRSPSQGTSGLYVELTVPSDLDVSQCTNSVFEDWQYTNSEQSPGHSPHRPGTLDPVWILDVKGHRVLIHALSGLGTRDQQIAQITEMVHSIRFTDDDF